MPHAAAATTAPTPHPDLQGDPPPSHRKPPRRRRKRRQAGDHYVDGDVTPPAAQQGRCGNGDDSAASRCLRQRQHNPGGHNNGSDLRRPATQPADTRGQRGARRTEGIRKRRQSQSRPRNARTKPRGPRRRRGDGVLRRGYRYSVCEEAAVPCRGITVSFGVIPCKHHGCYLHKDVVSRFMLPSIQQRTNRRSCHRGRRSATYSQKETKRGTSNRNRCPTPGCSPVQAGLNVPGLIVHSGPKSIS